MKDKAKLPDYVEQTDGERSPTPEELELEIIEDKQIKEDDWCQNVEIL